MITHLQSLAAYVRSRPFLAPGDSVHRAVEMLREAGADTLPVLDSRGKLRGVVTLAELRPLIEESVRGDRAMVDPIGEWMRKPTAVGRSQMSLEEARGALAASGETTLFILDAEDHCLGALTLADLLAPSPNPPRPAHIGGMATPWGVYLTNGTLQAGAGNWALIGSGLLMGLLLAGSAYLIGAACWAVQHTTGWPVYTLWNAPPPAQLRLANLGWFALQALSLPVFLIVMRLLPLAGYHAAEHQAVHAMERNEPLYPDVVRRMPRVHPRCGTNLMAAALVFSTVSGALPALQIGLGAADSSVIGVIAALFTWRSVGAFLQEHFTTRPATDRQIASGIAAANELEERYLTSVLRRPTLPRRLWCMGLAQIVMGASASAFAVTIALDYLFRNLK